MSRDVQAMSFSAMKRRYGLMGEADQRVHPPPITSNAHLGVELRGSDSVAERTEGKLSCSDLDLYFGMILSRPRYTGTWSINRTSSA
jgi:hypothetical protein